MITNISKWKNVKSIIFYAFIIIFILMSVIFLSSCISDDQNREIEKGQDNQFVIMSTTDIHGNVWNKDLVTEEDNPNNILRASTAASKIKQAYRDRSILVDNGDLYQGSPITVGNIMEQAAGQADGPNPAALALKHMQYDAFGLGNHEFNYKFDVMKNTYKYLNDQGVPCICANLYFEDSGKRVFDPYLIKTINVNGNDVKIAIIGLENFDCPTWDLPSNYKNIIFHSPENTLCDAAYEVKKVQQEMKDANVKADFTVVAFHSGMFAEATYSYNTKDYDAILKQELNEPLKIGNNTDGQSYRLIKNTTGIDMVIAGHDHVTFYSNNKYQNAEGKDVLIVNAGCKTITQSVFSVNKNQNTGLYDISLDKSENLPFSDFCEDKDLKEKIRPYADKIEKLVNTDIGKIDENFGKNNASTSKNDYYLKQTDEMDLINRVQMSAIDKNLKEKYSNIDQLNSKIKEVFGADKMLDNNHDLDADFSMSSVCVSENMHTGNQKYKDTYKIYVYDNTLCCIPVKGQDIKDLLEFSAENRMEVAKDEDGNEFVRLKGDRFTLPIFYGLNFTYKLKNVTGNKVQIESLRNGQPFDVNKTYIVVLNNYQLGNASNEVLARFDKNKFLWSQIDDKNGEVIQDYIAEYISAKTQDDGAVYGNEDIEKNHEIAAHWKIETD